MAIVTQDTANLYNELVRYGYDQGEIDGIMASRGVTPAQVQQAIASGSVGSSTPQPTFTAPPPATVPVTVAPLPTLTQPAPTTGANSFSSLINQIFQEQLGRAPDQEGGAYFENMLASGRSPTEISSILNQSLEGQNFDTQLLTSLYRQELGRNPEQAGFQYWKSLAQSESMTPERLREILASAADAEQAERNINGGFTNMELAALEADPYGGRYATRSIYDLYPDAVNISTIGDRQAQFVAPITQQQYISQFGQGQYSATPGQDVLSDPVVVATINRSLASGALDRAGYEQIVGDLTRAINMDQVRAAFGTPKAQVIVDQIYGLQTGEDVNLGTAQIEAAQRQQVINSLGLRNYTSNMALTDAYRAAGLEYPFGQEAYQGYDTMMRESDVVTPQNFNERVNSLLRSITGQFGGANQMQTPGLGQYYSETGLQPGFTPFGTEGTTFRSGVAGFVPQAQLPTGFQFGAPPVNATFQQYRPGAFQPEGVTTGGFITGYNPNGTPIYSTYNNPNVNVGGATSALNPFTPVQAGAIGDIQAQIAAMNAAAAAAAAANSGGGG